MKWSRRSKAVEWVRLAFEAAGSPSDTPDPHPPPPPMRGGAGASLGHSQLKGAFV